jgi:tetratricopeptide (TPR) repeat protein
MLALCVAGSGCSRTAETTLDEQQNPHYRAGKDKLSGLDYKGAIESFERAVDDNPRSVLAHFELGVLFEQHANDYAAALYHYNKALKLRPGEYPAENIRQRIPACKQELLKADSLAIVNPTALRETERLREENAALRKQVELLQAHLAARPPAGMAGVPVARAREASHFTPAVSTVTHSNLAARSDSAASPIVVASGRLRTHTVKAGETPFGISRQYRVKLDALLSANPSVDPRRIRVGQLLNIPAS